MLERKDQKKWFVWTNWGRVGVENPRTAVQEYYDRIEAMAEFERKFKSKTDNKWS